MSEYRELAVLKRELVEQQREVEEKLQKLLKVATKSETISCMECDASFLKKWLAVVQESYCRGVSYDNDYRDCDYWYFVCPICGEINRADKYPLLKMCSEKQFLGVIKKEV